MHRLALITEYTVSNHHHLLSATYRGESVTVQKGKVSASAWLDRKVVTAMATNCQPDDSGTVLRGTQDGSQIPVPCPQSIIMYNTYMGGVDRGDQLKRLLPLPNEK